MLELNLVAYAISKPGDTTQGSVFRGTQGKEMVTLNVTSESTELNSIRMSDAITIKSSSNASSYSSHFKKVL